MTTNLINKPYITVSLFPPEIEQCKRFAIQQSKPENKEKVFLNSLAVYAVHTYLKHGDIDTDLEQSSSWHPLERALFDVSDLYIPYLNASVECCPIKPPKPNETPIKPNETKVNFTANSLDKNIMGYVAVQFLETLEEVRLVGYLSASQIDDDYSELPITEFGHTSDIFDDLFILKESKIIWQEELESIEDEELKSVLEFLFTEENEGEITKSVLRYLKNRQYKWKMEEAEKALERFDLQQELIKMQKAEDALEDFKEEYDEKRKQAENVIKRINLGGGILTRNKGNSSEISNDLEEKLEDWFELIMDAIDEILELN